MRLKHFENGRSYLSLQFSPVWVDNANTLLELQQAIRDIRLLGVDAEWHDTNAISTL